MKTFQLFHARPYWGIIGAVLVCSIFSALVEAQLRTTPRPPPPRDPPQRIPSGGGGGYYGVRGYTVGAQAVINGLQSMVNEGMKGLHQRDQQGSGGPGHPGWDSQPDIQRFDDEPSVVRLKY